MNREPVAHLWFVSLVSGLVLLYLMWPWRPSDLGSTVFELALGLPALLGFVFGTGLAALRTRRQYGPDADRLLAWLLLVCALFTLGVALVLLRDEVRILSEHGSSIDVLATQSRPYQGWLLCAAGLFFGAFRLGRPTRDGDTS